MIFHWLHKAWFILLFDFALATLQNITVDDSVTIGSTAPAYLPSPSDWNQGNTCTGCYVQPDASLAYNGTWHDATFSPSGTVDQEFEFTFVGSALYIYFILANTVPYATTLTNVTFILDEVQVSTFTHIPTTSTDYEYNQVVYANDSMPYGQHLMVVSPANNLVNNTLMLFDYYIYTTNVSNATTTTTTTTTTSGSVPTTVLPSPSSVVASATSPNIGAIVGGVVGGLGAIAIVAAALLCYRRRKRRTASPSYLQPEWAVDVPFIQTTQALSENIQPEVRRKGNVSAPQPTTVPPSGPSVATSSSSGGTNGTADLREQVELLRDEVVRIRRMQNEWSAPGAEPPPEYSQD